MNAPSIALSEDFDMRGLLRQSLETALARHYGFEQRREAYRSALRHSSQAWDAYAELGLLAVGLPEEHGGLPGDLADVAMVAELMGGVLALEPYRATMIAARLLAAAGTKAQQAAWLPALAAGACNAALAHSEADGRWFDPVGARAVATGSGWRLSGSKSVVAGGDAAELFLVSALVGEETGLFLVPAEGVERRAYGCFDWTGAADLALDLTVPADARLAGGAAALLRALDETVALACADAVGAIRAANVLTREHARARRQFGSAIAGFQVLQHRMADMAIAEEAAAAITARAVAACGEEDEEARARSVSAAKVAVGDAARLVARHCVQIHGGMGLTEEYPAAHFFARLGLFERAFGDRETHLLRFAASV